MPINSDIIELTELVGRTIVEATAWSDRSSISIRLDNGGIVQIAALSPRECNKTACEPVLHYEVEFAPPRAA